MAQPRRDRQFLGSVLALTRQLTRAALSTSGGAKSDFIIYHLTVNGETLANLRPSGYFCRSVFLGDRQPSITVTAERLGRKISATRTFQLAD